MSGLSRQHVSGLSRQHMSCLSRQHMSGFSRQHMSGFSRQHMCGFSRQHMSGFSRQHMSGLPRTQKISNFGHEPGHHGSPRAHIERQRSHGLREGFEIPPGPPGSHKNVKKIPPKSQNPKTPYFTVFF